MQIQVHPLEPYFQQAVHDSYEVKLGLNDPEVTGYITRMLCEFSESDNLFRLRDALGHPVEELEEMVRAADPVMGTATSFDAERAMRKYIGDYSLFIAGMYPEAIDCGLGGNTRPRTLGDLIRAGRESYYIVSQFNLFEYKKEAALFTRLSERFESYLLGLALIREDLGERKALPPQAI
jgi:hypothetical protein